jgi:hypothetical protein
VYGAVFIPNETPNRWAFYSLCASCFARPDKAEAAERMILGPGKVKV